MNGMINFYFKFQKVQNLKSKYNLLYYSIPPYFSENFNPLMKPCIYAGKNPNIRANSERKSDYQISWNGKNLSSLYFFDVENPAFAYGDIYNTRDLVLFVKESDCIELFILKDKLNHLQAVLDLWLNDDLKPEFEYFREKAELFKPE